MILRYNPVVINRDGLIITRAEIRAQLATEAFAARTAGLPPPPADEEQRPMRELPARSATLSAQQRDQLSRAELRNASLHLVYDGTIRTRAAVDQDIRKAVRSPGDVVRMARQVESDSEYGARYHLLHNGELMGAILGAQRVNSALQGLGRAAGRTTNIDVGAR